MLISCTFLFLHVSVRMRQRKYLSAAHSEIHREGEALIDQYPSQRKPATPTQQVKSRCHGLLTLHRTETWLLQGMGQAQEKTVGPSPCLCLGLV